MQKRKCFILVKNEKNNTIDEYKIDYNIKELNDYTKTLIDNNQNDLVIKKMLESNYLGNYNNHKGILTLDKIIYLTNYINRKSGKELFGNSNFEFDYDSFLSKEEKIIIIQNYLKLLKYMLINSYDLDLINNALSYFGQISTPGTNNAFKGCQEIINISDKTTKFFQTANFDIKEKTKKM